MDVEQEGGNCFQYANCSVKYLPCSNDSMHPEVRYTESSAAWVLIAAIIVFFMKAGFMLLEVAFARSPKERRYVVVLKHQDSFASAFGFFLLGYDSISQYLSSNPVRFFRITDPVLWFFKFTFASNAATIVGGCLVTNRYKLRMPAAFISAFVISGIIHPIVARIIWSDHCDSLSPYRFCNYLSNPLQADHNCSWDCGSGDGASFRQRLYVLDFAGGGAVHLIGGMAGLMVCLFAKFNEWRDKRRSKYQMPHTNAGGAEPQEDIKPEGFWDWMYPAHGGEETVSEAALGVFILWFCWFAFNCGSAESVETGFRLVPSDMRGIYSMDRSAFYGIPAVIAVNMIMAGATGGVVAIIIAVWAQVRYRTDSVNANEIANGILSALVSITAGCAFVDYWSAALIGLFGVLFYHLGCFLEYTFNIKDTARVVPVHGMCGLWSVIATGLFLFGQAATCNLHAAFEGLCYCHLRLPHLSYMERLGAQIIGALIMIGVGLVGSFITYFILYVIPIAPFIWLFDRIFCLSPKQSNGSYKRLVYRDGWLLTHPDEDFHHMGVHDDVYTTNAGLSTASADHGNSPQLIGGRHVQGVLRTQRSNYGTKGYGGAHTVTYGNTVTPNLSTYNSTTTGTGTYTGNNQATVSAGMSEVTFRKGRGLAAVADHDSNTSGSGNEDSL